MKNDKSIVEKVLRILNPSYYERKDFIHSHNLLMRDELIKKYMKRAKK